MAPPPLSQHIMFALESLIVFDILSEIIVFLGGSPSDIEISSIEPTDYVYLAIHCFLRQNLIYYSTDVLF